MLSVPRIQFLRLAASTQVTCFRDFALERGRTVSATSDLRNRLVEDGYIERFSNWDEVPRLTDLGRSALSPTAGERG